MEDWERKQSAYDIVYIDPEYIHVLQSDLQQDLETFQEAVSRGLKIVPVSVIDDEDLMFIFCTKVVNGIKQASTRLQQDRDFVRRVISMKPTVLEHVDPKFKDDEEIVMEAVSSKASTIKYASERLRESKDIVSLTTSLYPDIGSISIDL